MVASNSKPLAVHVTKADTNVTRSDPALAMNGFLYDITEFKPALEGGILPWRLFRWLKTQACSGRLYSYPLIPP
jgi:hypothetical protein